jgi:glycerophosphoryl diester phosphodiesterase
VIGHRGASEDRPGNTMAAFEEALRQGAAGIEFDVRLSSDGVPVLYHDSKLGKAGAGGRRVSELDLDQLLALDVQGERIPLLECVLDRYGERMQLLVELKACEPAASRERDLVLARKVADTIRRAGVVDRSLVLSFDTGMLAACREQAPELRVVRNLKPPRALTDELREQLLWLHTLSCDVRHLSEEFGAELREAGRPLYVYTCNTPGKVDRALAAGAEAIMTDRPAWLVEYLARGDAGGP